LTEKATYAPGEQIFLNLCFKNVGKQDVKVVQANPLIVYEISVLFADGKAVPLTRYGEKTLGNARQVLV
jgi:hypothetical protein